MDTDLRVAEVGPRDEPTLRAYWSVSAAARRLDEPLIPIQSFEELLADDDNQPSVRRHRWIAHHGDQPVGLILLELPALDNTDAAHATVEVHPKHRRRGIGRTLLGVVLEGAGRGPQPRDRQRRRAPGRPTKCRHRVRRVRGRDARP